jgi:hypothetical protein
MPTKPATPAEYVAHLAEPRRTEVQTLHDLFRKVLPKLKPSIQYGMIGYGTYHYKYESGREGDAPIIGLASRSAYISVYGCGEEIRKDAVAALPKAKFGKGCINIKRLADVDLKALADIVKKSAAAKHKQ